MRKSLLQFTLLSCLFIASACSSNNENNLEGKWRVDSYADPSKATLGHTSVASDEIYTLIFHDTGLFSFTTDCNTISGEYTANEHNLQFENISATELACDKEIVERSIKCDLPMVVSYDLPNDSTLLLLGRQGNVLIKLIKINKERTR